MCKRNLSIDLIKVLAMFSVLALHSFGARMEWGLANIFYESAVIGIPVFFMVSGYLLIGKQTVDIKYVCNKICNILRLIFILSIICWIFMSIESGQFYINYFIWIFKGAFIQNGPLWICWYLASMIIIYSLLPIVNKLFVFQSYWYTLLFLGVIEVFVFWQNIRNLGEQNIIQTFRLWNWLFYFLLGGGIKRLHMNINLPVVKILIVFLLIMNVFFQEVMKAMINSPYCEYFYCSVSVILLSALVFLYFTNIKLTNFYICRFVKFISPLFLPIYLFHPLFLDVHTILPMAESIKPFACFVVTTILSVSFCFCLNKVGFIRKRLRI